MRKSGMFGMAVSVLVLAVVLFGGASNSRGSADDVSVDLWPLLEVTRDGTTVCYPFYASDGDFKMILNFYARTNHGRDTHIFWPFVKFSDGKLKRAVPFWFKGRDGELTILPFLVENKQSVLWTVPPVYVRKDGSFTAVYPFYVKGRDSLFVFPDIYMKDAYGRKSLDVFPFYSRSVSKRGEGGASYLRMVNYISKENSRVEKTIFFPFYEREDAKSAKPKGSLFAGLYYSEWDASRSLSKRVLLPFFGVKRSECENYTWAFNYYSHKSKYRDEFDFYPFYGEKKTVDGYDGRVTESSWVFWPFYSKAETRSADGKLLARKRRFLFFSNELDGGGRRTFSVFGQVVREKVD